VAEEKTLDLRGFTTLCGDYSVHIMTALEELPPGGKLKIVAPKQAKDLLRDAVENVLATGAAEKLDEGEDSESYYVVLKRTA
jgi:TusA-related sulfurtransferase